MPLNKRLTPLQATEKIKQYCSYQERSHSEVKRKLYGYGLYGSDVEQILVSLLEENYLNEERYATAWVGGHFRLKKWGRNKLVQGLKQQGVTGYNLTLALAQINEEEYRQTLATLAEKKWNTLATETLQARQAKTFAYLQQKGYEPSLISPAIKALAHPQEKP